MMMLLLFRSKGRALLQQWIGGRKIASSHFRIYGRERISADFRVLAKRAVIRSTSPAANVSTGPIHQPHSMLPLSQEIKGRCVISRFDGGIEKRGEQHKRNGSPTLQLRWRSSLPQKKLGDCRSLGEMVQTARRQKIKSTWDLSAFWSEVPKFLQTQKKQLNPHEANLLDTILKRTLEDIEAFSPRNLALTTIALAKIMKNVSGKRPPKGSAQKVLRNLLIGDNSRNKREILFHIATSIDVKEFDAQSLSDFICAFGIANYVPKDDNGSRIFDFFALEVVSRLETFDSRQLFNILWAFASVKSSPSFFGEVANKVIALDLLKTYNAEDISDMVWAYATSKVQHPKLFTEIADQIMKLDNLRAFKPQDLSNIVLAYATLNEAHPQLFKKVGDHIAALDDLNEFDPQAFSGIVWAFATTDESHLDVFEKVADHMIMLDNLGQFSAHSLSDLIWVYATAGVSQPQLFKKVAVRIIRLDNLDSFEPQHLCHIMWAYATARESHPKLFKKVADHIFMLRTLGKYSVPALSDIIWAYATSNESHPKLFKKVSDRVTRKQHEFTTSQDVANFVWAYATIGHIEEDGPFKSLAPTVEAYIGECNTQGLANIAWAYSVANVDTSTFVNSYILNYLEKERDFTLKELSQLYQWHMWQEELNTTIRLPITLRGKCHDAFISRSPTPSILKYDVISELSTMGLQLEENVFTERGYCLDAIVEVNRNKIGIEVDEPTNFILRKPKGSTILKRRQVTNLEGIPVVSVPFWEWDEFEQDSNKKQHYLCSLLDF